MRKAARVIAIFSGIITVGGLIAASVDCVREKQHPGKRSPKGIYEAFFKRMLDFMCGIAAIIVFSPVYLVIGILVRLKLGSPVLFSQERPGKDEKIFRLYKFRTMTNERDANGNLLPDEARLTNFGRILRTTSLDELPEALNIIKGDMSVIGPRPLLVKYLPRYNEEQRHRHDVRPGLTGYAQAHGRNTVAWEDRFAMDVRYTGNVTFRNDLQILLDTVKTVVKREGITSETSVTMEEFRGNT